jgi:hypothetical protein
MASSVKRNESALARRCEIVAAMCVGQADRRSENAVRRASVGVAIGRAPRDVRMSESGPPARRRVVDDRMDLPADRPDGHLGSSIRERSLTSSMRMVTTSLAVRSS